VRLAAQRSLAGWLSETTGGLSYLEFIRTLGKRVEEDWEGVQVGRTRGQCAVYDGLVLLYQDGRPVEKLLVM
jgi:hypothetical protein